MEQLWPWEMVMFDCTHSWRVATCVYCELSHAKRALKDAADKLWEIGEECAECNGEGKLQGEHGFEEECGACHDVRLASLMASAASFQLAGATPQPGVQLASTVGHCAVMGPQPKIEEL